MHQKKSSFKFLIIILKRIITLAMIVTKKFCKTQNKK